MTAGAFYLFRTAESVDQLGPGLLSFLKYAIVEKFDVGEQTIACIATGRRWGSV
jgi:hypothetical protein